MTDFHIIVYPVEQTTRQNQVPFNTPYGTYCTLSRHAFGDVLDAVVVGMKLFRAINKENCQKVFDWFAQFNNVFDNTRRYRYFIETWKTEEIIDRAYEEMQQYALKFFYKFPKKNRMFDKKEVLVELNKFSTTFPNQDALRSAYKTFIFHYAGCSNKINPGMVLDIYEASIKHRFLEMNQKYHKFLEIQEGKIVYEIMKQSAESLEYFILGQLTEQYCENEEKNGHFFLKRNTKPIEMSDYFTYLFSSDKEFCDVVNTETNDLSKNGHCGDESTEKFLERKLMDKISGSFNMESGDIRDLLFSPLADLFNPASNINAVSMTQLMEAMGFRQ